ncbi:hypothetical protein J27TS8_32680 [Robertmurraya siralis]|jgi:hypothetical protein|uniref:Uncharacterized protein n=1 Tax=Robertmurraya siralis TaxID=77777 RepID=A0A920BUI4_9BACI|nr:hypothetical protein J27TS8_32680 [Robertmurraya siralis]
MAGEEGLKKDIHRYRSLSIVTFRIITDSSHTSMVKKPHETSQEIMKFAQ